MKYIGVIGASASTKEEESIAYEVGKRIGEENETILVCGGMGGVMESASKGCSEAGGIVFGVLPGHDRSVGNKYLTYALPTGMGEMRNFLVVRFSDVLISISGEFGTLSEIAIALKEGKKVIALAPKFNIKKILTASTSEEAVNKAFLQVNC